MSLVLALGDNFYPHGIPSHESVSESFRANWVSLFLEHASLRVPWRVVLGNHDYDGTPLAEILFTTSELNLSLGSLWQLPAKNHRVDVVTEGCSVRLWGLDTNAVQMSVMSHDTS